ncbi:MAG: hypothetical protein ACLFOZ_11595 [Cyclobacteriaceae bacterium]
MICPAFQSSFILDDSVRYAHFSNFGPDSLPKNYLTAKNRYGIIEGISDLKKQKTFKTVEMVTVFPPPVPVDSSLLIPEYQEDSLRFVDPQLSRAAK